MLPENKKQREITHDIKRLCYLAKEIQPYLLK